MALTHLFKDDPNRAVTVKKFKGALYREHDALMYTIKYKHRELTKVVFTPGGDILFSHTEPSKPQNEISSTDWFNEIEVSDDWKEILGMSVDPADPESVKQFKDKAAEIYWKLVHLMPTNRSSANTALKLNNLLYRYKGLRPPAPARAVIMPDCYALTCTLEEYLHDQSICWEDFP